MENLFIPVLLGTARKERESEKVAHWLVSLLEQKENVETQLADVRDMGYSETVPPWGVGGADEKSTQWKKTMGRAHGLMIVTPEYNHGYPGELKMALDSLYKEYERKPVSVCGVSSGGFGGVRVVENIQPVLTELRMLIIQPMLYVSNVADSFTDEGPKDTAMDDRAQKTLDLLVTYAQKLC